MTRVGGSWLAAGVALAALCFVDVRGVRACSTQAPPPALVGVPADGTTGVPTDVRPVYDVVAAGLHDLAAQNAQFELLSPSGVSIAVTVERRLSSHFELALSGELAPVTTYTLRGRWTALSSNVSEVAVALSFTTAAGRLDGVPAAPAASLRHYRLHGVPESSCGPPLVGTCVSLPAGPMVQVTYLDSFGQELVPSSDPGSTASYGSIVGGPFFTDLAGIGQGTNFECVVLRARGDNGGLSAPTRLCGDDAPRFELAGSPAIGCGPAGLTHDGELVLVSEEIPSGGCEVVPGRPSLALLLPVLLLGTGAVVGRRQMPGAAPSPRA